MRGFWTVIFLVMALGTWTSCGAVIFGEKKDEAKSANTEPAEVAQVADVEDCDALMQELAENCFMMTAYEEDGVTVLHVIDELGNDLGEIDLNWVASYCECYAQLSFQTFGCSGVLEHEALDDAQYEEAYGGIRMICAEPVTNEADETDIPCAADDVACLEWQKSEAARMQDGNVTENTSDSSYVDVSHCQANDMACIEAAQKAAQERQEADTKENF